MNHVAGRHPRRSGNLCALPGLVRPPHSAETRGDRLLAADRCSAAIRFVVWSWDLRSRVGTKTRSVVMEIDGFLPALPPTWCVMVRRSLMTRHRRGRSRVHSPSPRNAPMRTRPPARATSLRLRFPMRYPTCWGLRLWPGARAHAGCPHRPLSGSRPGPFWAWLPSGHIRRRSQNNGHQSRSADQAGVGRPNSREYAPRGWNRTAAVAPKLLALSATATARESAP
jgi:hypothetical protein